MRFHSVLLSFSVLVLPCGAETLSEDSAAWVCEEVPRRVEALFESLDLDRPDMTSIRQHVAGKDWPAAAAALVEYYRNNDNASWLRNPNAPTSPPPAADAVLDDTFTFYEVTATVPRTETGGLDWNYRGPSNDHEWALALNRHFHLNTLLSAYLATGDTKYVDALDESIRDWILNNPYPGRPNVALPWRGLEAHFRVTAWARSFYALQDDPGLTSATRLLILTSIPEHAHYLRSYHKTGNNWITMEMNGLSTAAACWPEFREAGAWMDYAIEQFTREIGQQIYPDGAQHELTSHYHRVTLVNFDRFATLARHIGLELPERYRDGVESMWNYLAYTMRPDGHGLLNNDSDRDHTEPVLNSKADEFRRPDWKYIVTQGAEGSAPDDPPSRFFPWAGQAVMRNGWSRDAHWSFFDVGPLGSGHVHYDKLHLSIAAGGRDLLVDGGRFTYVGGPWRNYFVGSASHNVLLIDGQGQDRFPNVATEPLEGHFTSTPEYDLAWGQFDSGYRDVNDSVHHTRVVAYLRDRYWLVIDRVDAEAAHRVQALWHFNPECDVAVNNLQAASRDEGKTNIAIVPTDNVDWSVNLVRGQEEPTIQGWWSRRYNEKTPNTTVVYETSVEAPATWAWLIVPHNEAIPAMNLRIDDVGPGEADLAVTEGEHVTAFAVRWSPTLSIEINSAAP